MLSALRALAAILTPRDRREALRLAGLMVAAMLLETAGVGLVIPVVALLLDPGAPFATRLLGRLGNPAPAALLIGALASLLVFTAVKSVFLGWVHRRLNRFIYGLQAGVSHRLFETYLRQPWVVLLSRNSAELIRNMVTEVNQFVVLVAIPAAALLAEGLVLCGLGVLLAVVEPRGAAAVLALVTLFGLAYQRLVGPRLMSAGRASQLHDGLRIQHIQQGLGGAKEVKLLEGELEFLRRYALHNVSSARAGEFHLTALQLPRLLFEPVALASLTVLVGVMRMRGEPVASMVSVVALFGAAALRMMPSINRMFGAVQSLRYGTPAATLLRDELAGGTGEPADDRPAPPLPFRRTLRFDDVTFTYAGAAAPALSSVSLTIRAGECLALTGPSGSGKSTAVDVLLGLLPPQSGRVLVDDVDILTNLRGWRRQVGYVAQTSYLTDDTLRRNVAFGVADGEIDDARVWAALRDAQLDRFVSGLPGGLEALVGERGVKLSGGQRQRVGIARALYRDPAVLVMDEPTSALDTDTEREVLDAIRGLRGRKTILLVAHRASTIAHCDREYRLDGGRVVEAVGLPA